MGTITGGKRRERHLVAEVGQAPPVIREQVIVAHALEVIGAEVVKGHAVAEHVIDRDEEAVGDGDDGFLVATPAHQGSGMLARGEARPRGANSVCGAASLQTPHGIAMARASLHQQEGEFIMKVNRVVTVAVVASVLAGCAQMRQDKYCKYALPVWGAVAAILGISALLQIVVGIKTFHGDYLSDQADVSR